MYDISSLLSIKELILYVCPGLRAFTHTITAGEPIDVTLLTCNELFICSSSQSSSAELPGKRAQSTSSTQHLMTTNYGGVLLNMETSKLLERNRNIFHRIIES